MTSCDLESEKGLESDKEYVDAILWYRRGGGAVYIDYECDHFMGLAWIRRRDVNRFRKWLARRGGKLKILKTSTPGGG